jgi:hypothetical protein
MPIPTSIVASAVWLEGPVYTPFAEWRFLTDGTTSAPNHGHGGIGFDTVGPNKPDYTADGGLVTNDHFDTPVWQSLPDIYTTPAEFDGPWSEGGLALTLVAKSGEVPTLGFGRSGTCYGYTSLYGNLWAGWEIVWNVTLTTDMASCWLHLDGSGVNRAVEWDFDPTLLDPTSNTIIITMDLVDPEGGSSIWINGVQLPALPTPFAVDGVLADIDNGTIEAPPEIPYPWARTYIQVDQDPHPSGIALIHGPLTAGQRAAWDSYTWA